MKERNLWTSIFEKVEKDYMQSKHKYSVTVSLKLLRKTIADINNDLTDCNTKPEISKKLSNILLFFWIISNYYRVPPTNLVFIHTRKNNIELKKHCLRPLKKLYIYEVKGSYPEKIFIEEIIHKLSVCLSSIFYKFKLRIEFILNFIPVCLSSNKKYSTNDFDPSNCDSLTIFNKIVLLTPCPYALSGKYWGAPNWNESFSFSDNIKKIAYWLKVFLVVGKAARFDGFVVVLPSYYSNTINCLSTTLANFIQAISQDDRNSIDNLTNISGDKNWSFLYSNETMFITALGVCYEENNPRHTYGINSTIFFLQPDFTLRSIDALRKDRERFTREKIRSAFSKNGISYTNTKSPKEHQRYIRSEYAGKEVVEWWKLL